jgi:hypothetical protein
MPQKLAGARTEPPVSVPSARSASSAATATAEPEEEPPGSLSGARGLIGAPSWLVSPNMPWESSSVCVLPMNRAPAASSRATASACRGAGAWPAAQSGLPARVTQPATSIRSFTAKRRPESGPAAACCGAGPWLSTKAPKRSVTGWRPPPDGSMRRSARG